MDPKIILMGLVLLGTEFNCNRLFDRFLDEMDYLEIILVIARNIFFFTFFIISSLIREKKCITSFNFANESIHLKMRIAYLP